MEEEAKRFLETKKLKLANPMEGYIIPYSYLIELLCEFKKPI